MAIKTDWYKNAVVYQIYPFSFKDSDNDGWGDIKGIISKLDYVKNLGATAIWFSPLYDSPDKDYGYDIRDYRKIDEKFGTMDDFRQLLDECHARGLKVIMDMVVNHTSDEHTWFKQAIRDKYSPYRDYYIIREGKRKGNKLLPPTDWTSSFTGSAWSRIEGTDDYYLHLFCKEQPDLNWENPEVRKEIVDILKFYLDMGVDGFRFDVFNMFSKVYPFGDEKRLFAFQRGKDYFVDGPRMHEFLHELYTSALSLYDSYTVGESYQPSEEDAYNYVLAKNGELDTIFNFAHLTSDNMFSINFFKKKFNLLQFKDGFFGPQRKYFDGGWNTLVLENHDLPRSNSRFGIDVEKYRYEASTFLPTITFMGFGTPYIYMGEEIGLTNTDFKSVDEMMDPVSHFVYNLLRKFHVPEKIAFKLINNGARDHARVPMQWNDSVNAGFNEGKTPWQRMNSNYKEINATSDLSFEKSVYKYYQKLLKLKTSYEVCVYGETKEYDHKNRKVIAYSRDKDDVRLFVVGNFSGKKTVYKLPRDFEEKRLNAVLSNYDGNAFKDGKITLRPYEAIVFATENK